MITIDLSTQQILDVDPKAIQQINVTGTLERAGNRTLFFFTEEVKGTILHFRKETMTQHNTLNVKLSNSRLNKSKSGIKNSTHVTLHLFSNAVGESSEETNFIHKLLLNTQVSKICKAFANGTLANIKFSKTQLSKMIQSEGFLCKRIEPLLKTGLHLIMYLKPLAKGVLIPLVIKGVSETVENKITKRRVPRYVLRVMFFRKYNGRQRSEKSWQGKNWRC